MTDHNLWSNYEFTFAFGFYIHQCIPKLLFIAHMKTVNANAIFPSSKQFETIIFNVYFIHIDAIFKILETRRYFGFYDIIVEQRNGIFIPSGRIAI